MSYIYLAGGMKGHSFKEANAWRLQVAEALAHTSVRVLSPMRGLEFLGQDERPMEASFENNILSQQSGIVTRDYLDIARSDAIVVNFLGAKAVSIGTVWEIGCAYALKKPVVLIMEEGNLHDHPMILESARYGYHVDTVEEAIALVQMLLLPVEVSPLYTYEPYEGVRLLQQKEPTWGDVFQT